MHSYVYCNTHQTILCSLLHLVSFKVSVGECQVKIQTNCRHLLYIGCFWHLSLSAVIVCIVRVVFISGRLDWADQ